MSSAPSRTDLLHVLVADADPVAAGPLLHALERNERTVLSPESGGAFQIASGRITPTPDVLFINAFDWALQSAMAETLQALLRERDRQRVVIFARPDQFRNRRMEMPEWMRVEHLLITEPDPESLQAQVDAVIQQAWDAKHGASAPPDESAEKQAARPRTKGGGRSTPPRADAGGAPSTEPMADTGAAGGQPAAADTVQVEALYMGLPTDVDVDPQAGSVATQSASASSTADSAAADPYTADPPASGPADVLRSTGPLPLSASAQPAVRNAVAYHRAAPRMPMGIALLAGIAAAAEPGPDEDTAAVGHEDTAALLARFLREGRPAGRDIDLLGLGTFGIGRQPPPLPPFAELAIEDPEAGAELERILEKAAGYARRVYPSPDSTNGPPLLTSVRHLLAALVTDDAPAFAVPRHLQAQGYSVAELRAALFRLFSTLTERTDAWREILRPLDVLTRAESTSGGMVLIPPAEPGDEADPADARPPSLAVNLLSNGGFDSEEEEEEEPHEEDEEEDDDSAPRGPRALRFATDAPAAEYDSDSATGTDLLNVTAEVNALSAVLASKELQPPLSVGLFGDWGTGKSFFMGLMRRRIRQLSRDARERRTDAFCPRIVQITFNAWHYMDANLWASLVSGVFDGLARALSTREDRPAAVRERLLARLAENHAVLAQAEQRKLAAKDATRRAQEKLDEVEREKGGLRALLDAGRDTVEAALGQPEVRSQIAGLARQVGLPESTVMNIGAHREALETRLQRARVVWRIVTGREGDRRRMLSTALFAVGIVALGFAGYWTARGAGRALEVLAPAAGVLLGLGAQVIAQLRPLYRKVREAAPRLREIVRQAEGLADRAARRRDEAAAEARRRLAQLEAEEAAAREAHAAAVRQVQAVDAEIQEIRAGRRLHRFISERSAAQDYRRHLGIVALVRDDFQRLSRLLSEARTGVDGELPPVDRIVLYIDDLDRCPEKRVVEVLQAVHLLLAFPLFVVVVGVDSRWLLRSVQRHYAQLADGGDDGAEAHSPEEWASTPQNYLEKIFQIPFTLRPMQSDEYATLIRGLVPLPGDAEPAGMEPDGGEDDEWVDFLDEPAPRPASAPSASPVPPAADADAEVRVDIEPVHVHIPWPMGQAPADDVPPAEPAGDAAAIGPAANMILVPHSVVPVAEDDVGEEPESGPVEMDVPDVLALPAAVEASGAGETSGGVPSAVERESAAQAAVRAAEQGLAMERHERDFLQGLSALIPSPRSAKRLVNVYRFIRASLDPAELASFVGAGAGSGDHQCVALLLAVVTGFPTQSVDVFRALEPERAEAAGADWWTFFDGITPREVDAARWEPLRQAMGRVRQKVPANLPLEPFVRWAPHVARFSFQTGQLFARRHG